MDKKTKTNWLLKNKKADLTDSITVVIWLFIIGVGILCMMFMILTITPELQDSILGDDVATSAAITSLENYGATGIPSTFLIIFFGLELGVMVSSFFIRIHPIFIPVYILFAVVSIIVAVAMGNAWGAIQDVDEFATILALNSTVGIMDTILSNLVLVCVITFILSLVIVFAKPGAANIGQGGSAPY